MKKLPISAEPEWTDPDDAPVLTPEQLTEAEVYEADRFLRRLRGRPPADHPKEKISVRLDATVLERLRAAGPGWQTRVNSRLAKMLGTDKGLWDRIEQHVPNYEAQCEVILRSIAMMEGGELRVTGNNQDETAGSLEQSRLVLATLREGIEIMRQTQLNLFRDIPRAT